MHSWWEDLVHSIRVLLSRPLATGVAVVTLALGLGANTALFGVVNALILRPMPVRSPERLVVVSSILREGGSSSGLVSYLDLLDYRKASSVFEGLSGYRLADVGLATGDRAERAFVSYVTSDFFSMLGVHPAVGRLIRPGEGEAIGSGTVVVLGHSYWKRRFASDPAIAGRPIRVNGQPCTIVGVVPASFIGAAPFIEMDAYLPVGMSGLQASRREALTKRDVHAMHVIGRLVPGISIEQAQAGLALVAGQLERQYPDTNAGVGARLIPERWSRPEASYAGQNALIVAVFLGLAGLVLLVAAVNVTNLRLVEASLRHRELAVRSALGASRGRIARLLLTESLVLAAVGTAAGVAVGTWVSAGLAQIRLPTETIPVHFDFGFDWRGLVYVAALGLLTTLVVGVAPARHAAQACVGGVLRDGRTLRTPGRRRLRDLLVVGQVAISLVLLIVAGLFVRSLGKAQEVELGIRPEGVLNLSLDTSALGYDEARSTTFFRELRDHVRALPGVQSVSWAWTVPLGYSVTCESVEVEGRPVKRKEQRPAAACNFVDPDYLATMGVRLLRGRGLLESDESGSLPVALVNETMARRLWPGQEALGRRFRADGAEGRWLEVVGIVANGKYEFIFEPPTPHFYAPLAQHYRAARTLHVRTHRVIPSQLGTQVTQAVRRLEPDLPVYDVQSMEESLQGGNGFFLPRLGAALAAVLGAMGLVLAVVGVYGVVAYSASQRTAEIGLRMALGAGAGDIRSLVLVRGVRVAGAGIAIGLGLSLLAARAVGQLMFGISPYDPVTFSGISVLLAGVVLVASSVPARRASRLDPVEALREQ